MNDQTNNNRLKDLIVELVRKKRRELGFSQEYMGCKLGQTTMAFNRFENGKNNIDLLYTLQVFEILGLSRCALLDIVLNQYFEPIISRQKPLDNQDQIFKYMQELDRHAKCVTDLKEQLNKLYFEQ